MRSGVSLRQLCAAICAAMLLPAVTQLCRGGWAAALLGALLAGIYYIIYVSGDDGRALPQLYVQAFGQHAGKLVMLASAVFFVLLAGVLAAQSTASFPQLRDSPWAGLGILVLAAYAASKGTATVLRCGSVLLVPLAAAFCAVLLCAAPSVTPKWLLPQAEPAQIGEALAIGLLPAAGLFLLPQVTQKNTKPARWGAAAAAFTMLCAAVAAGVLSPAFAARPMSFYTLARSISVFGVMVRLEVLISGAMTMCAFVGCALLLSAGMQAIRSSLRLPGRLPLAWLLGALAAAGGLAAGAVPLRALLAGSGIFCGGFPLAAQGIVHQTLAEKKFRKKQKNS